MKLFGNTAGKHVSHAREYPTPEPERPEPIRDEAPERPETPPEPRKKPAAKAKAPAPEAEVPKPILRDPPEPKPARAPQPIREEPKAPPEPRPEVQFETVSPEPEREAAAVEITDADAEAPRRETKREKRPKKKSRFLLGYVIYIVVFLILIAGALGFGWYWLDNYEQSRPHVTMENYLHAADSGYWHDFLTAKGVEESFVETLDLTDVSYYKKMDRYTDAAPAYGIRFGDRSMLITVLKPGHELAFQQTTWDVDTVELVPSRVSVYAPAGATLRVRGLPVEEDCLKQRDALALSLGELEQSRTDIPGLDKYEIGYIYGNENLSVTDAEGRELPLSERRGSAYYYAPLTESYTVTAPVGAVVTVNGVTLSEANAAVETVWNEDLEDMGAYLDPLPGVSTYRIEGLVARPEVSAEASLFPVALDSEEEHSFTFVHVEDPAFTEEVRTRVMNAFDAYIAFSGNRGADLQTNYNRYLSYLVPGSVAADRAAKALDSLYWVKGRDTALQSYELKEVLRYGENCFTALIDYKLNVDGSIGENSTLFLFVRYNDAWRIYNILNKSTVV